MMGGETEGRLFHGWKIVGTLFAMMFFGVAGKVYVFPVFVESFQAEFGWSMTQISGGAAVMALVQSCSNPVAGALFARLGARKTMLIWGTVLAFATLGYAFLVNLWMFYALLAVTGFSMAGATSVPATTLVVNWFDRHRGRAMALTMVGVGAGGLVLPAVNEWLIRLLGWRQTWACTFAVLVAVVIPLIAVYVRTRPEDLGLLPDGMDRTEGDGDRDAAPASGLTVRRTVTTGTFWLLVAVYLLQLIGVSALGFHFVPFAIKQLEFTSQQAAFYYGFAIGFSILGRLLSGWLSDRWAPNVVLVASLMLLMLSPLVLEVVFVWLGARESALLWLYAVPFGTGMGATGLTMPILVGRCFGELHYSRNIGIVMGLFVFGILGIPGGGRVYDTTGSYELMLIACIVGIGVAALLATQIRPARHHAEFVTA